MSVLIKIPMPQNCRECRFMEIVHRLDGRERYICIAHLNEITDLKERLDTCPLEEQKRGKWEDVEEVLYEGNTGENPYTVTAVGYKCSECGTEMGNLWSFCPNCGARMDVADNDVVKKEVSEK